MNTINKNISNEIIVNKSKFITFLYKIKNEDDALNIINNIKKEYKDASHVCYAYITDNIKRFNDDKEPNHTAGMPILNVLENKDLNNVLAITVRYFGGIKLGSGGLTRAYSNSISEALDKVDIIPLFDEHKLRIEFEYKEIDNINYYLRDYKITYKEFNNNVIYEFTYTDNNYPSDIDIFIIKKEEI